MALLLAVGCVACDYEVEVTGVVTDDAGKPLKGIVVVIEELHWAGISDESGCFRVEHITHDFEQHTLDFRSPDASHARAKNKGSRHRYVRAKLEPGHVKLLKLEQPPCAVRRRTVPEPERR
jgi:hypothetical protein